MDNRTERPLRLVLMGTGPFAVPSFAALHAAGHTIAAVVCRPEISGTPGRKPPPSPVRVWAESVGLLVETPASINTEEAAARLQSLSPDLLVVCDYGQILKRFVLATARLGGINLHGSLLPAYRGAAPVQCAVWRGERETGVSVIHMTPKLDGGPLLSVRRTEIGPQETAGELEKRLSELGVAAVLEAAELLSGWDGQATIGTPQDDRLASGAPRLSKADGKIDWSRSPQEIDWQVRAMQPWPGAFCFWNPPEKNRSGGLSER